MCTYNKYVGILNNAQLFKRNLAVFLPNLLCVDENGGKVKKNMSGMQDQPYAQVKNTYIEWFVLEVSITYVYRIMKLCKRY